MILRVLICLAAFVPFTATAEVKIETVTSEGGITAWLVQEPNIPFVAMDIALKGGTSLDAPGKRGAVNLMTGLLEEGAGERDDQAFAEAREALAARFSFDANRDSVTISAQFLTENRAESLALLKDAIQAPRFDEDAVARVQSQVLAVIEGDRTDPNEIAGEALSALAFPGHPYGSSDSGTIETVTALTRDDIIAAHKAVFAKDRLIVGVVGDITPEALGPILDDLFGALPATGGEETPEADYVLEGGVSVTEFPTPQSVVMFSHPGLPFDDERYLTLVVLNQILGGGSVNARLNQEVRVNRGLTYGISSYPVARDLSYLYMGQFSSSNAVVGEAIDVVRTVWEEMGETGPSDLEVERAITYLTGAYPLRFDGNSRIASILVGMQLQGLPIDYIATRNDRVRAITPEDVRALAKDLFNADDLHFVVVGEPVGL